MAAAIDIEREKETPLDLADLFGALTRLGQIRRERLRLRRRIFAATWSALYPDAAGRIRAWARRSAQCFGHHG